MHWMRGPVGRVAFRGAEPLHSLGYPQEFLLSIYLELSCIYAIVCTQYIRPLQTRCIVLSCCMLLLVCPARPCQFGLQGHVVSYITYQIISGSNY